MERHVESTRQRLARVLRETIEIVAYDERWPQRFAAEKKRLQELLPAWLVRRIEHFGSTAVPGLAAKPVIDMLVEVSDLAEAKRVIVPILVERGYEYFWRPSFSDDLSPHYAWFIKRGPDGRRTHHIHCIESHFEQWDGLLFRDYLIDHPEMAHRYAELKEDLSSRYRHDREAYTRAKSEFIRRVTSLARRHYADV